MHIEIFHNAGTGEYSWRAFGQTMIQTKSGPRHPNVGWELEDEIDAADVADDASEYLDAEALEAAVATVEKTLKAQEATRERAARERAAQYTGLSDKAREGIAQKLLARSST